MKVSVVIPTKNEEKNLPRLLRSLNEQTYKSLEIIVVDNYSTDKTQEIAKKITSQVFTHGCERSAQRNFGLGKARGEFVFFLDADMVIPKNLISQCLKTIEPNKEIVALTINEITKGNGWLASTKNLEKQLYTNNQHLEAPRFLRKQILIKIGGFDEKLISGEDWDLATRVKKQGKIERVKQKIIHIENGSLLADLKKKYYYATKIQHYAHKNPKQFKNQSQFSTRSKILFQKPSLIFKNPHIFLALLFLKLAQYATYRIAKLTTTNERLSFHIRQLTNVYNWYSQKKTSLLYPKTITYITKHFIYKYLLVGKSFKLNSKKYKYFYSLYNFTYASERCVEIPIILDLFSKHNPRTILEIGNVLSHYFPVSHTIIDKYEKASNVQNVDIVGYKPKRKFDLIVSISTIEHVGFDEEKKDDKKILTALYSIKKLLSPNGTAIITLPFGYNRNLDKILDEKRLSLFTKTYYLKKISQNTWEQTSYKNVTGTKFNKPFYFANAIAVAIIKND